MRNGKSAKILGERVLLRPVQSYDREEFLRLNRSSKNFHQGLVSPPTDSKQFADLLKRSRKADVESFVICRKEDGAIVGWISLSQIFMGSFRSAYLGYYIGVAHSNQGFMTEALNLMLRHAFERLKLHRVEANIQPNNVASVALVVGAGFVREGYSRRYLKISGRWRDHERWALLTEDWKVPKKPTRYRSATT